jgi:excinuclease UvrABC nuclease subunit
MKKDDIDYASLPDEPGVYFFSRGTNIQYVGKATSLRSRVRSYFDPDLALKRSPVVAKVVEDATKVTWEVTDSVLEALLLEANYIKELKPLGNTLDKDDKSFNYVVITNEVLPRVLTMRGRELAANIAPALRKKVYGPFTQGGSLKEALKIIRRIFPYFDTKFPVNDHYTPAAKKTLRFNQSIGLYPSEDRAAYLRTIRNIMYLFEGKKKALIRALETDMKRAAKNEAFEEANTLKRQLFALTHIRDIALLKDEFRAPRTNGYRIEAYDTAHLGGSSTRAVMTVVVDGEKDTNQYRIFTIRTAKAGDDYEALREVLTRRFNHPEWPHPQLIVIDGGRAHLKVATDTLKKLKLDIEVCAVVKDDKHKAREILGKRTTAHNHKSSILLGNAEAHRFSIARHRRALRKRVQ